MIVGKITSKAQTTVPLAVRRALGLAAGDEIAWAIEDGRAVLTRVDNDKHDFVPDFSTFTEWASKADCEAYDNL